MDVQWTSDITSSGRAHCGESSEMDRHRAMSHIQAGKCKCLPLWRGLTRSMFTHTHTQLWSLVP